MGESFDLKKFNISREGKLFSIFQSNKDLTNTFTFRLQFIKKSFEKNCHKNNFCGVLILTKGEFLS